MSPAENATLLAHRTRPDARAAMVFVHGFGGDAAKTWGQFPTLVSQVGALEQWDIYSLGYSTGLAPDIRGIWAADPSIETLAKYFGTRAAVDPLKPYQTLALIAHSMGGLVVQRALVGDQDLVARTSHVFLFGTPSAGLKKAGPFSFFKPQLRDMGADSTFIKDLRARWEQRFGTQQPFKFWAVAGDRDVFVPPESSLAPFPEKQQQIVLGNHLEIVKPENLKSMSVQVVAGFMVGAAAPAGPWNAARVAVEMGEFQRAISLLAPHAAELDETHIVELALALDSTGQREEAIRILKAHPTAGTDARGVLAGRLKRRWMAEGRQADADSALATYREAYAASTANPAQAYYHGINVAFMELAYAKDESAAAKMAKEVLVHCGKAKRDYWCVATEGEARLYLGQIKDAMMAFAEAVSMKPVPKPRHLESTYTQASWVIGLLGDEGAQADLDKVFRQVSG